MKQNSGGFSMFRQSLCLLLLFTVGVVPALPQTAADHIVSVGDVHQSISAAALSRQMNLAKLEKFLSTESAATALDRKSTRLNSSHTVISYAVFCLKKKKKKIILE